MNVRDVLISDGAGKCWFNSFGSKSCQNLGKLFMAYSQNITCNDQDMISNIMPNDIRGCSQTRWGRPR